jgi:hypothetical protein
MNAMTSEKLPSEKIETTVEDPNLAAVSEVEAGIRDFVRNDVAYLRRSPSMLTTEPAIDASAEATVNNVNSLIQRVAGSSLAEIENLVSELESLRPAQPGGDEIDPHDRRQRRAMETRRRRAAQRVRLVVPAKAHGCPGNDSLCRGACPVFPA